MAQLLSEGQGRGFRSAGPQEERYGYRGNRAFCVHLMGLPAAAVWCVSGEEFGLKLQQRAMVKTRMTKALSGVFRTQVFSSRRTSLSDAHRFCQDGCSRHECCDGFVLNQNTLEGGALPWRRDKERTLKFKVLICWLLPPQALCSVVG